ncbi:MAG TPA: PHP domain-containing protein [Clostridia bacterium]|nr:PHP domain-containing protein [Clostridia bacterium]
MRGELVDWYSCDLHVHTALSPCASEEMTPAAILLEAMERGLDVIGICDHNSARNLEAIVALSPAAGIKVFCGMEVQTQEEVHVLCFFHTVREALDFQDVVYSRLPKKKNVREYFGSQLVFDHNGELVGEEEQLLLTSVSADLKTVCDEVAKRGGMAIPSHVDRMAFGLLGVLGMIPDGLSVSALEISRTLTPEEAKTRWKDISRFSLITSSDAHCLGDIGAARVQALMNHPSLSEFRLALMGIEGRKVVIPGRGL